MTTEPREMTERTSPTIKSLKDMCQEIIEINVGSITTLDALNHGPIVEPIAGKLMAPEASSEMELLYDLLNNIRKQSSKIKLETTALIGA